MAKFVQPNILFDSSVSFLRNVTFDSSVYLQGVAHISSPTGTSGTPYALVVDSLGADVEVKSIQLGTMATATATDYTLKSLFDSSVAALKAKDTQQDASLALLYAKDANQDTSLNSLWSYNGIQDVSIDANWQRWVESNRTGFLNQTETTISFNPGTPTGSGTFTLADAGSGWSYYRRGEKFSFTGNKTVALNGGAAAPKDRYFIYIDSNDGTLISSTTPWTLSGDQVLVAYIEWNPSDSPTFWIGEERHSMLIDRRMHQYLHQTRGTQFVSGGALDGPQVGSGTFSEVGLTDASNALGIEATTIADEDIFQSLAELVKPATPLSPGNTYLVWYRNGSGEFRWKTEDTPLPESGSYIEWCQDSSLVEASPGKFVNTYVLFTNLSNPAAGDKARFSIVPGWGQYDTLDEALAENPATHDWGDFPIVEYVIAWQLNWETSTGYATKGKVALASAPVRISVNATSASSTTTQDHNTLLGLQGGTATERYHLSATQYTDYAGKSYVDSSLSTRDTRLNNLDTSVAGLDTLTQSHTASIAQLDASVVRIDAVNAQQDASIIALRSKDTAQDVSIAFLRAYDIVQDSSITSLKTRVDNHDTSIAGLNTLTIAHTAKLAVHEASIGFLWSYDQIQDASIVAAGTSVTAWNGLTRVDNSIGLGGTGLVADTIIYTNTHQLAFDGTVQITGDLTVDGSLTYINTAQLNVSDNIIEINSGLTGTPPVGLVSGMKVNRGSSDPYFFIFSEADDTFRIGQNASEGGLPSGTQAVATRQDTPVDEGIAYWNDTLKRFDTSLGFRYNDATGLSVNQGIYATGGATFEGLSGDTQTYALMTVGATGGTISTRQLGSNAFSSATFATIAYVDGSLLFQTNWNTSQDASIIALRAKNTSQDSSITALRTRVDNHDTSIAGLNTLTVAHTASIAQLDASVVRIDASLNDVIDILSLGFATDTSVNSAFAARDISIAWLNTNKLNLSGGTMSGVLTFGAGGFILDSVTLTDVDTSGNLTGLDTHIPTSGAVSQAIAEAIVAGVTASNGVREVGGDIRLGGNLIEDTSISGQGSYSLTLGRPGGEFSTLSARANNISLTTSPGGGGNFNIDSGGGPLRIGSSQLFTIEGRNSTDAIDISTGGASFIIGGAGATYAATFTDKLGTPRGIVYGGEYQATFIEESLITKRYALSLISGVDSSIVSYIDTYNVVQDASILANSTNIGNLETSVGALDLLTQRHEASIGFLRAYDIVQDASILAAGTSVQGWNGITRTDNSIGLGGTLVQDTSIQVTATNGLSIASASGDYQIKLDLNTTYPLRVAGPGGELTIDGNALWVRGRAGQGSYLNINDDDSLYLSAPGGSFAINASDGDVNSTLYTDNTSKQAGIVYAGDYTFIGRSLVDKNYVDTQVSSGVPKVANGLQILPDGSIGLGGNALNQAVTTITTNGQTNSLRIAGLTTSVSDTPYALVQNAAAGDLYTRQLGTAAWATISDYATLTYVNTQDSSVVNWVDSYNVVQDASILANSTALGNYVLKTGDLMTGGLQVGTVGAQRDVSVYGGLYVHGATTIGGNLYVDGSLFVTDVHTIDVSSGFIRLNTGMTGTPPSSMQSGIAVERGSLEPYVFIFDESTQDFRIGIAQETSTGFLDASTQAVATREDNPNDTAVAFWNATANRFDTDSGFYFDKVDGLGLDVSLYANAGLHLAGIPNLAAEATALVWDGDAVGYRELGSNAFTSTTYAVKADVDSSLNGIWVKLGSVDTSLNSIWTKLGNVDTSLNNLGIKNAAQDASISALRTRVDNHDTSIAGLNTLTVSHTASITDLSTNKLDAVANTTGASGEGIFAIESGNTAYLKRIVQGTGATITSDASTITIAVSGAAGYVSKYKGTFDGTASSPFVIPVGTHGLGTGPFTVSVYESGSQVYTGVDVNGSGDVTLSWSPGSLVDASCQFLITG